jgi:hypothetical protein
MKRKKNLTHAFAALFLDIHGPQSIWLRKVSGNGNPPRAPLRNSGVSLTMPPKMNGPDTLKAILTDVQFWIPAVVLLGGVILLVLLH